jgi:hypothetical protein
MPAIETQAEADEKMVDLPSTGDSVDVTLDDTELKVNKEDEVVTEDIIIEEKKETASKEDMEDYGKKVQSRIDKLTKKVREAERREQAATQYAKNVYAENQTLQQKTETLDDGYVNQYETRVNAELDAVKKQLRQAIEVGDMDKQVEANQALASLTMQSERVRSTQDKKDRLRKQREEEGERQPQYQQQYAPPQMPPQKSDPKAESWAEKNEWFGKDEPMTLTSFSIHRNLVEEGFDPQSDSYYSEVDIRMKKNFPHKFDQQVSPTQTVASASRGGPVRRKGTVRLTPSQVAISKKLGVPLSEYAKYVKE